MHPDKYQQNYGKECSEVMHTGMWNDIKSSLKYIDEWKQK